MKRGSSNGDRLYGFKNGVGITDEFGGGVIVKSNDDDSNQGL